MSLGHKIHGIIGTTLQLDLPNAGPLIKNLSGVMSFRNAADSDYMIVRGLPPVGDDDLVTQGFLDPNEGIACISVITVPFHTGSQALEETITIDSTALLPTTALVFRAIVEVTEVYDSGSSPSMTLGQVSDPDAFMVAGVADPQVIATTIQDEVTGTASPAEALRSSYIEPGVSNAGAAQGYVYYSTPSL